ncbi:MAG: hypothetical protein K0R28_4866 [Paenibacillus sp.]|uniref:DUF2768 family protein n=1 Tax=Paenibacillus mesophilus TaxID=2582849 RepID=UPI00110DE650|nr:DUF2768 family protein [Paenibacillus mesophilus]MDF2717941.1 hypothetical protein [Paenibacillus sp.]TMV51303.1 DUF2768 family protein [Paenibacillus mesophilus]
MSSMDKMWASFIGMGLMVLASFLISFARIKLKGVTRGIVSVIAFVILLVSVVYMLLSIL